MCSDEPSGLKFICVRTDFLNLAILTKSATPGEIQATYVHAYVGNKSLSETSTAFALEGYLKAPTVVLIYIEHAFDSDGENICLTTTEVLHRAAAGKIAK